MIYYFAFGFPVRVDSAFICANTGSRHTYSDWLVFIRTNDKFSESPIESYLAKSGKTWEHRWISYAGTGKNVFGKSISWGHGSPGSILDFQPYIYDYVAKLSDEEKERIYHAFSTGTQMEISKIVFGLQQKYLETIN